MRKKTESIVAELGDRARDKITGFEGVVTGRCQYLTGCDQILLNPPVKDDGDFRGAHWFDIDRCEVKERGVFSLEDVAAPVLRRVGPDAPAPKH